VGIGAGWALAQGQQDVRRTGATRAPQQFGGGPASLFGHVELRRVLDAEAYVSIRRSFAPPGAARRAQAAPRR
jgi:hypothetical protein